MADQNSVKRKRRRRSAAEAPPRRLEQVGLLSGSVFGIREKELSTRLSIRGVGGVDPVARSLRNREFRENEIGEASPSRLERVEQHRAAEA